MGILLAAGIFGHLAVLEPPMLVAVMALAGLFALVLQARLALQSQTDGKRADLDAMRLRFEALEDRAWELSESEERYRAITDAFGDLVVIRDHAGNVLSCNTAYAESLGLTQAEVLAGNVLPATGKATADGQASREARAGLAAKLIYDTGSGKAGQGELAIDTHDGGKWFRKWFHWLELPVRDDKAGHSAILCVARDITPFKRSTELDAEARKQAEQANRAKSRFLAMASHEMRTPLNGIIGMSKLLGGTALTPEQHNYTDALQRSGKSLLHLIEGMLDLTTIEAGRFVLKPYRFDPRALLEDTLELLHAQAAEKNIGLGLYVAPEVPARIESDGERMRQVLINLIGNAIKFTETGGVAVECKTEMRGGGETLVLRIRDTGPGLSEADRARIFREFERVDDENTRSTPGAGLGLAISRALAEQFGGALELEDTGPQGSTFAFSLPLLSVGKTDQKALFEGRRIALAIENAVERDCLARSLADKGASVLLREENFSTCDTILVDGEAAPNLLEKQRASRAKDAPRICVLLAAAQKAQWSELRKMGADAWLTRPVRATSLDAVIGGEAPPERVCGPQRTCGKDTPAGADEELQPAQEPAAPRRRILLAEDNDINALLATAALSKAGHDVVRAHNGEEAVERCATQGAEAPDFDLILMDMHMPVMDGIQAIGEIRRRKPAVPILILSADGVAENRAAAIAAGADGCLSKPVDPIELLAIVTDITAAEGGGHNEAAL